MGLDYGGHRDFVKEDVLDAVVIDGDGPAFAADNYQEICIQVLAEDITDGADIILKKSIDDGVTFKAIAQIDLLTVAAQGTDFVHEFKIFDEPLGQYIVEIANRTDGTYTGTARASK